MRVFDRLRVLLYGEYGMLYRIESGWEEDVVNAEKEELIMLAEETSRRYQEGCLEADELLIYIDIFDVFSSFQDVDWIREMTAKLHSILMRNVTITSEPEWNLDDDML